MAKVRNDGRRYVGEDRGETVVIEHGAVAEVSEEMAATLVPGCGFSHAADHAEVKP